MPKALPKSHLKRKILIVTALFLASWMAYHFLWGQYLYRVTAYCDCPICINVDQHRDSHFASGRPVYWGGVAADRNVPFRSSVDLVPHSPQDMLAVYLFLRGRRSFLVEDRGGQIRGRKIDVFIPHELGGHETARNWGVRNMRIKVNGAFAK
jgi:3D (Asp-Asp-Asp) domain-containing protein